MILEVRVTLTFALMAALVAGQEQPADVVRLDFPDNIELKVVVDYVAATLDLNLISDDSLLSKKVSLRVNQPVAKAQLLNLLRALLRSRGLALVQSAQPGWLKIVSAERLSAESGPLRQNLDAAAETDIVTLVLPIRYAEVQRVHTAITPYLTKPGGSLLAVPESRLLLITDYADNVRRMTEITSLIDVQRPGVIVETVPVTYQNPAELATLVTTLMSELEGTVAKLAGRAPVSLRPDPLGGGLIAIGLSTQIQRARELVRRFDVEIVRRTELYQPRYIAAKRLRSLIDQLLADTSIQMSDDDLSNTLVVTAVERAHIRIAELLKRFDAAPPESSTPLRFYKLMNRRADDVFATLGGLLGGSPGSSQEAGRLGATADSRETGGGAASLPPTRVPSESEEDRLSGRATRITSIQGENFSLSLDEHTNSIIVIAPPELHQQIEQLIERLDKRRPQVLVEVTLVSVSAEESINLGVELQALDLVDPLNYLLFTSFGLSNINPTDGTRRLNVLPGGTGVLLAPHEVPIIIQALATRGDTRVYSAARILVDDNAVGRIESVAESPFTSVNASNTVATTSFSGFAKAGTQLSVAPHIAEGDHVEINYSLTVSSFTGTGTGSAPPPRSSDTLSSTIRVPDGYTVIVGGLLTETLADSSSHVPLIGDLPLIGWLFGSKSDSRSKVRLYAFIRPTILRDDRFEDLKYLSLESLEAAGVSDGFPPTRMQTMR